MSKEDIVNQLKDSCDNQNIEVTKSDLSKVHDLFMEIIKGALDTVGEIRLHGIGTLCVKITKERQCLNPQTKAKMTVPAKKRVKFKSSQTILNALNKKEKAEAGAK
ncbi:MAG: DNA-binding protein HRm [Wolbachia endosymbiont of Ctenocephalides orientis wCori]|nr:MAG: DNA-binding protein HRm [Wolbachia endosymbiont of Ctenocephalides orientis wCori]